MQVETRSPKPIPVDMARFADGVTLAATYSSAFPFPHIVLDGRFDEALLEAARRDIDRMSTNDERNFYGAFRKRQFSDRNQMPPAVLRLIDDLNSPPFLAFLEQMTGVTNLVPDLDLNGGGVHQIGTGGFLKVHTDFNWHGKLRMHRRINALLYLNRDWNPAWNGQLELWTDDMAALGQKIEPLFNRLVVFSTTDGSYHGHPEPLTCPEDVTRNSIALYYYTVERPTAEVRYGRTEFTNYRERPNEAFVGRRLKHHLRRLLLRHPRLRSLIFRK